VAADAQQIIEEWLAPQLIARQGRPLIVGLCGAQGSGKSTVAAALVQRLAAAGVKAATLSLDDLYLPKGRRAQLGREVHPLLVTRGVPGTHDMALGIRTLDAIRKGESAALPRFDKSRDDREPEAAWTGVAAGLQVLVFEGWCVGATPQRPADLHVPINDLERREDADARWRTYVNDALAGPYQALFARVDRLALLAAPGFEIVQRWRGEQEAELRRAAPGAPGVMEDAALRRFIEHYERLTRHILQEMPSRADLVIRLSAEREVIGVSRRVSACASGCGPAV
jgi:D-glycerate 3-kinase